MKNTKIRVRYCFKKGGGGSLFPDLSSLPQNKQTTKYLRSCMSFSYDDCETESYEVMGAVLVDDGLKKSSFGDGIKVSKGEVVGYPTPVVDYLVKGLIEDTENFLHEIWIKSYKVEIPELLTEDEEPFYFEDHNGYTEIVNVKEVAATKKVARKKATPKDAAGDRLAGAELKKAVAKIKKLLTQRDCDAIDTGIELARSLGDPGVFEALLEGCSIEDYGDTVVSPGESARWGSQTLDRLIANKLFSGSRPAQPYLYHAMLGLIGCAPDSANLDPTLVPANVKTLDLSSGWGGGSEVFGPLLRDLGALANCTKLTKLDLCECDSLQSLDGLQNCTKLTELVLRGCSSLHNVDGLANCTKLTKLDLGRCDSLENVDGLANCTKMTNLAFSGSEFTSLPDGLDNCTKLTELDLVWCESLVNVDGLANCTKLTELNLSGCKSLVNVDGLANCTKLTELNLKWCKSLVNVDGLANCSTLTDLILPDHLSST